MKRYQAVGLGLAAAAAYKLFKLLFAQTYGNVFTLVGNTPIVELESLSEISGCTILAKLELNNPGGSAKDRVAKAIIEEAELRGLLRRGHRDCVFEGTSGSTGISLATLCNSRGYEAHIVVPNDTSDEKMNLLRMLGAKVHLVSPAGIADPGHYVNTAKRLTDEVNASSSDQQAIFANQFENEVNWKCHYATTGPEIWSQANGKIDAFVSGAGTGGTISGIGRYLKDRLFFKGRIVLADPPGSGLFNKVKYGVMFDIKEKEGTRRRHQVDTVIEGIGLNRVTANLKAGLDVVDDAIRVPDAEAVVMAHHLVEHEGLFVGSSSAVNCVAAFRTALELGPGHTIVTIICDSGMRHLSKFWKQPVVDTGLQGLLKRS